MDITIIILNILLFSGGYMVQFGWIIICWGDVVMRLHSMKIEGFRRHFSTDVKFSEATFLIGTNNIGKSSVLKAIEYLLTDIQKMPLEDFFCFRNEELENEQRCSEVVITGEFRNVPEDAFNWEGF